MQIVDNVSDRRRVWIGSWQTEPLDINTLTPADIGRTVIYRDYGRAEAGTLASYNETRVWARFSQGDTAAACNPSDLVFGIAPTSGPEL